MQQRAQDDHKEKGEKDAYNQVVVPELRRISFPPQVLPDRQLPLVIIVLGKHPHRARVKTRNVEQHAPHPEVEHASGLAKHAAQAVPGPLERAAVARDAERHLGLDNLDVSGAPRLALLGLLELIEEAEEVGVCRRVEDDL
jgi:hypothetical protein